MRKILYILLVVCSLKLVCCNSVDKEENIISSSILSDTNFEYFNFSDHIISYSDIINLNFDCFYLYFYSTSCGHCNIIKQDILMYFNECNKDYFLVEFNENIKICNSNLEVFSIFNFCIYGTPTLVYFEDYIFNTWYIGSSEILDYIYNPH